MGFQVVHGRMVPNPQERCVRRVKAGVSTYDIYLGFLPNVRASRTDGT